MAQCSQSADVAPAVNGEVKKRRNVAVITGITGQVRPGAARASRSGTAGWRGGGRDLLEVTFFQRVLRFTWPRVTRIFWWSLTAASGALTPLTGASSFQQNQLVLLAS